MNSHRVVAHMKKKPISKWVFNRLTRKIIDQRQFCLESMHLVAGHLENGNATVVFGALSILL